MVCPSTYSPEMTMKRVIGIIVVLNEAATRSEPHVPDPMGSPRLSSAEVSSSQKYRLSMSDGAPGSLKGLDGSRCNTS